MACLRSPSTSSTPNALEPTQLISLKYSGLHSQRPGACTPAFTNVSTRLQNTHTHLESLGLADGVVDHVDGTGVGHRQALQRLPQSAAAPRDEFLDDGKAGFVRQHHVRAQPAGQLRL